MRKEMLPPLDLHGQMLMDEYLQNLPMVEHLQEAVLDHMRSLVKQSGIELNTMESRIKTEASLHGKLLRKGSKYSTIQDVTDILGVRIIAFYNEDVDRIASMAESLFEVDWANSVDKRQMHQFDSFGYNSLHYICRLPRDLHYDRAFPKLNEIPFELQIRTALQHVWSAIQHDIGYKTDIETPMEYHRSLSRLAGLLELADNEFSRIRHEITDYRRRARTLIENGKLSEVTLNADTFRSYVAQRPFDKLCKRIAAINQAEIQELPVDDYLKVMRDMGLQTLADVEQLVKDNSEDAYQLALLQLGSTDLDILASTIGLQNLCIVAILKAGGGRAGLRRMFDVVNGPSEQNEATAQYFIDQASRLAFMNKKK